MYKLEITESLKAGLSELYFREECSQKGWAFALPQRICNDISVSSNNTNTNHLVPFRNRNQEIRIRVMQQLVSEIKEFSQPSSRPPYSSIFSYLVCKVGRTAHQDPILANPSALCWVQIRKGRELSFSDQQIDALARMKLPLVLFYVRDVLAAPRNVEVIWDSRSGTEWLDMLDDLKEQEEYDDEYF
ncbi:MAG TPA: hypothetical protein VJP79_05210 [Nitrososphaera sp.]|nr:hypothetical protein [Nitrososphaera sp.]